VLGSRAYRTRRLDPLDHLRQKNQIFATLGFAVLYSTLVLYATGYDRPLLKYFDGLPLILVRLEPNHHRLGFRILLQHFVTHFAAPAGLFVTAKRQSGIKYVVTIDPDRAGS
jgi:hypothetical protein